MLRFQVPRALLIAAAGAGGRGGGGGAGRRHSWKRRANSKLPTLGQSGATNPNRPLNQALAKEAARSQAQQTLMEDLALNEDNQQGGDGGGGPSRRRAGLGFSASTERLPINLKRGADVAHEAKAMSDAEWEHVPLADKHNFVKFISEQLESAPSEVSEMQRRRYYETTMFDPTREDPHRTVRDSYERVKLGLPTRFSLDRSLGVPDAVYEQADASLFDPQDASKIENAMTEMKQMFTDYVKKKRLGVSTEGERRALSLASQDLNLATQKHLSEMFKFAENQLQETMREERQRQLKYIARVRAAVEADSKKPLAEANDDASTAAAAGGDGGEGEGGAGGDGADEPQHQQQQQRKRSTTAKQQRRRKRISTILRRNYGLDLETADAVLREMRLQEKFLRECEVLARMTRGQGFQHSARDEGLDAYAEKIRNIYSMNPQRLCKIDAVQYVAALEGSAPVDWAAKWYAQSLLLPLQTTPEYKALQRMKEEEQRALTPDPEGEDGGEDQHSSQRQRQQETATQEQQHQQQEEAQNNNAEEQEDHQEKALIVAAEKNRITPAQLEDRVVDLTSKMFLDPDDERLRTMHEKRLRYIAHVHMESQIKRMRENARLFEGAEDAAEAQEVKALYEQIQKIRNENRSAGGQQQEEEEEDARGGEEIESDNIFERSEEAARLFGEVQKRVRAYIARRNVESAAEAKASRVAALAAAVASADESSVAQQVRRIRDQKKKEQMRRLLDLLERDVRQELYWIETFAEADRPAPLPMPSPMSYVSAADVLSWRDKDGLTDSTADKGNPFKNKGEEHPGSISGATFLGQPWQVPDKPLLFWGTGARAVEQALQHEAEDAERRRRGEPLAPPYPCAENPWGWRLAADPLDDDEDYYDQRDAVEVRREE